MIKNKTVINILFFTYAFFSFAVFFPGDKMDSYSWIRTLFIYGIVYSIIILFALNDGSLKPLTNIFLFIYVIYLLAVQIFKMWHYMNIYHGNTSAVSTLIISFLIIMLMSQINTEKSGAFYVPIFSLVLLLIFTVIILNLNKINAYNITTQNKTSIFKLDKTLFEFIIPYIIAIKRVDKNKKKTAIIWLFANFSVFILITLFAFMCIKGDLLYSLSPLQMLFQLSYTRLIRNFDALFNYLLYFAYIGALISLIIAYRIVKADLSFINDLYMLLIIPLFIFSGYYSLPVLLIDIVLALLIAAGKERKAQYEKDSI